MFLLFMSSIAFSSEFKPYPGAKIDVQATNAANKMAEATGIKTTIYTTADAFEKVLAFYQAVAKQYEMPYGGSMGGKLPSGQSLQEVYFIFDGASDLANSNLWSKIQRPFIGSVRMEGLQPKYDDIRDVTAIILAEKK
jgi:hypothetical protein